MSATLCCMRVISLEMVMPGDNVFVLTMENCFKLFQKPKKKKICFLETHTNDSKDVTKSTIFFFLH